MEVGRTDPHNISRPQPSRSPRGTRRCWRRGRARPWNRRPQPNSSPSIKSFCAVPLLSHDRVLGALNVGSARSEASPRATSSCCAGGPGGHSMNAVAYREIAELKEKLNTEKLNGSRDPDQNFDEIVGQSPAHRGAEADRDCRADRVHVLIQGETGTGKELLARAIHNLSAPPGAHVRQAELRGHPHGLLASLATSAARSPAPSLRRPDASSSRMGGTCSSTRSGTSRWSCSRSSCACCRNRN